MRFRLHTKSASSGQVKRNETAIAALSSQVDALQVDVDAISPGGIEITTGVNDTLMFQHVITSAASPNVISYMYTIVLAGQRYTTDEMLTAINAAIVTAGSVQNAITTTMAFSGDRFIIRCTADTSVFFKIQVVQGSASAAESIGFVQNRIQQGSTGGDLDLVATNEAPIATGSGNNNATIDALLLRVDELESAGLGGTSLVTTQVTGEYPVSTVGGLDISSTALTPVTFADAFSNGISHAYGASIFNVTAAGDYTINVQLQVTDDSNTTGRGVYWVSCRRYQNRTTTEAIGTAYRDYYLGNCFYRDNPSGKTYAGRITLGGNVRVHLESTTEQFEIIVQMLYQGPDGILTAGDITIDNSASWITIERHDT